MSVENKNKRKKLEYQQQQSEGNYICIEETSDKMKTSKEKCVDKDHFSHKMKTG